MKPRRRENKKRSSIRIATPIRSSQMPKGDIIYGVNSFRGAIKARRRKFYRIVSSRSYHDGDLRWIYDEALKLSVDIHTVSRDEIERLTGSESHQGIAALTTPFQYVSLEDIVANVLKYNDNKFILILDSITDPNNLGALIRTAHLMG